MVAFRKPRDPHAPVWYRHSWGRGSKGNWHPLPRDGAPEIVAKIVLSGPAPVVEVRLQNEQIIRVRPKK